MARIHKVVAYIVDLNEEYDRDRIEAVLENYLSAGNIEVKSSDDFEWDINLSINKFDCPIEEYEKYLGYKPIPCDCYRIRVRREPRYSTYTGHIDRYVAVDETYCVRTKECEVCNCEGDKKRCSFYTYKDGKLV